MKLRLKGLLVTGVLLSVPATLYGLVDTFFQISGYGTIGSNTMTTSQNSLAVGFNNIFMGGSGSTVSYSAAIGYGLQVATSSSLVVGRYNSPDYGAYFVVGNGSSGSARSNALTVSTGGTVIIPGTANIGKVPDRGGISMGVYTVP